jgi:hypothetical protein
MKKLIYLILLLPFSSMAQTIDTTYRAMPTCKISSVLQDRLDTENSVRVGINSTSIDFCSNSIVVNYVFFGATGSQIANSSGYFSLKFPNFITLLTALKTGNTFVFTPLGTYLKITYQ